MPSQKSIEQTFSDTHHTVHLAPTEWLTTSKPCTPEICHIICKQRIEEENRETKA